MEHSKIVFENKSLLDNAIKENENSIKESENESLSFNKEKNAKDMKEKNVKESLSAIKEEKRMSIENAIKDTIKYAISFDTQTLSDESNDLVKKDDLINNGSMAKTDLAMINDSDFNAQMFNLAESNTKTDPRAFNEIYKETLQQTTEGNFQRPLMDLKQASMPLHRRSMKRRNSQTRLLRLKEHRSLFGGSKEKHRAFVVFFLFAISQNFVQKPCHDIEISKLEEYSCSLIFQCTILLQEWPCLDFY